MKGCRFVGPLDVEVERQILHPKGLDPALLCQPDSSGSSTFGQSFTGSSPFFFVTTAL
jgi:hypothetical protein